MKKILLLASIGLSSSLAFAHVSLDPARIEAGKNYRGVLRISHGCDNAPTTAVELQLPTSITRIKASSSLNWQLLQTGTKVVWTAEAGKALAPKQKGEFPIEFKAPDQPGALWIGVQQRCGASKIDWSDVPAKGTSTEGMKTPAILLQVVSAKDVQPNAMQPRIDAAWVRATVPGQQATGAFMRITAKEPMQLVGASTPVAGTAEVHQMKMEGDVMRMRPAGTIELRAGQALELKPGGYHLMLQDLKKPLEAGSTVPLTLVFRNAKGVETREELQLPVAVQAPAGSGMAMDHKH